MPRAKGSAVLATLEFLVSEADPGARERILAALAPEEREKIEGLMPTDEVSYRLLLSLWRAADDVLRPESPAWIERSGAYAIESMGVQMYGGILRKASPLEFLTQRVSLFRLYYQPGNMEVVEHEPGRAVLRLVGFDPMDPLFCRRQSGGLLRSVELAGGTEAKVRHVRCSLEGDAFCEWELKWS